MDPAGDHSDTTSSKPTEDSVRNNNSMDLVDPTRTNVDGVVDSSVTSTTTTTTETAAQDSTICQQQQQQQLSTTTTSPNNRKQNTTTTTDDNDSSGLVENITTSSSSSTSGENCNDSTLDTNKPVLDSNDNVDDKCCNKQSNVSLPETTTDDVSTTTTKTTKTAVSVDEGCTSNGASLDEDGEEEIQDREFVPLKVVWKKQKFDVNFALDDTVAQFKDHINTLTGVPPAMQKVMYKGLVNDDSKTLRHYNVTSGAKIMIIGSTVSDIIAVNTAPSAKELKGSTSATGPTKEPLSKQKPHRKVLEKGKPDDVLPAFLGKESLPTVPLSGMLNKTGGKVRLTFKMEADQLWIGTKERTEKLPMSSIKSVISEPIEDHKEYHMMALQLGPTEASRYWIYWVPAQFVDAIKDAILGKWAFF